MSGGARGADRQDPQAMADNAAMDSSADLPAMAEFELLLRAAGLEEQDGLWRQGDEVGAVLTGRGVFIGWLDVAWDGPSTPEWHLRDVVHLPPGQIEFGLAGAVSRARARRESALRTCHYCGEGFVPGHMHSGDVCQGCAERHLGVVH